MTFTKILLNTVLALVLVCSNFVLPASAETNINTPGLKAESFVAQAVEKVGSAVVRIDTQRTITREVDPVFEDPMFRYFFGDDFNQPKQEIQRGQGSGFIINNNGIILTNAHVVDKTDKVTVTLKDGRTLEGEVKGIDEVTDLAVVKIPGNPNLPVVKLGDSEQIRVGDWAIAVGNPLGLDNTVTLGIISTLNRSSAAVGLPSKRLDFIQTDAAINPGNSGGPLLNANGEVIGINTAIRPDAMGIGFAIPINKAKGIVGTLSKGEKVAHAYLGVQMQTLTKVLAQENNNDPNTPFIMPEINGVLVLRVLPNSPAAKSGLRRGDVIIAVDKEQVNTAEQLQQVVENSQVGQSLNVKIQRGEKALIIPVKTEEMS
ncbi:MAG TPA: HhoA/HhoB/HtrA family serine endopeptidase [Allocoleopsis sp.]